MWTVPEFFLVLFHFLFNLTKPQGIYIEEILR